MFSVRLAQNAEDTVNTTVSATDTVTPLHELVRQQMSRKGVVLLSPDRASSGAFPSEPGCASNPCASGPGCAAFSLGVRELDAALPHQGLPYGTVTELRGSTASGAGTSFALRACYAIQSGGAQLLEPQLLEPQLAGHQGALGHMGSSTPWCAYLDPNKTLFAPGVAQHGVDLQRLLLLRPSNEESLARTAIHIAQSGLISLLVLDLRKKIVTPPFFEHHRSTQASNREFNCRLWVQTVRRLSLAIENKKICLLLLTQKDVVQSLPLPVGLRLELAMQAPERLAICVTKERTGKTLPPCIIPWEVIPRAVFPKAAFPSAVSPRGEAGS